MPGVRHTVNSVRLPRTVVNQLLHLAQKTPDEEICGLISRDARGFRQCYPVPNTATDTKRLFALDPKVQIDTLREMHQRGEELGAIFHSHPGTPPVPSHTDIEQHEYPEVLYLIISLGTRGVLEMRGFRISENVVDEIPIGLEEASTR